MNMTYFLFEASQSRPFSTIIQTRKGLWRVLDDSDSEVFRFVDSSTKGEKAAEILLGGSPDRYAVVSDDQVLAHIRMEARPEEDHNGDNPGLLKRILKTITRRSDWVMALEPAPTNVDHRALLAGMILLIEHTIAGHRSD